MDRNLDFTLGTKFSALPDMIKDLHAHHQRYVLIVVPGAFVSSCVCSAAFVWQLFPHTGSGHQQRAARGLVLAVRGRDEERRVYQRLWRKCHYWEGESLQHVELQRRHLASKAGSSLRCGPAWPHFPISPMRRRTNGGTTTWRGSTRRCPLMGYGL